MLVFDSPTMLYLIVLAAGLILGYVLASRVASIRLKNLDLLWRERIEGTVRREVAERESLIRRDAATKSGKVLSGRVLEKFSPLMEQFPFDPHDAVWIGNPIDFIVFDGLSEDREGCSELRRVVLVEVKSGSSHLSKRQKRIKDIVKDGRVSWEEVRIIS